MPRNEKGYAMTNKPKVGYSPLTDQQFYYSTTDTISRLDYFAGLAMQAYLYRYFKVQGYAPVDDAAKEAKEMAIAMLNELDKPNATS